MYLRTRLTVMQFLQFFVWGAWLVTIGAYCINTLNFTGAQVGTIFSLMGFASLFTPALAGMIADRWLKPIYVYAILQTVSGLALIGASFATSYQTLLPWMMLNALAFMATIPVGYAICYDNLERAQLDIVGSFPKIRVFGTLGFIAAMWTTSLNGWELTANQLILGGVAGLILAAYSLSLPKWPVVGTRESGSLVRLLGLDSFKFFKQKSLAVFFIFAFLLGTMLQLSNNWVDTFLHSFASVPAYESTFAVRYPAILVSLSQFSEMVFILLIPFFLRRYGIKVVMLMALVAWVLRFALLGLGNPGPGLWMLLLAMLVYGCAFDFFNVAGSLYTESQVEPANRSSAQGMFMMMVNGFGVIVGSLIGGFLFDAFTVDGNTDWRAIWLVLSVYAAVLVAVFIPSFKYKHVPPPRTEGEKSLQKVG